ncbi:sigma-70 family RNA polymerase sigma factor [Pedobacter sp. Du54]|uniref:RNA polymerase sigma factor n=1 Tax=Pedobacter anseongensis TaxID=3133439 RepID=UPI0030A1865E
MDVVYIRKVLNGDTEAFSHFITTYKHMAFTIALSVLKDEFLAEEAVQKSFIVTFSSLSKFHQQSKFSTWFYRIVTNESLMMLRKLKREPLKFMTDFEHEIIDEDTILHLEQKELVHLVNEGLKHLPPNESLALRLFYLDEESVKNVCEITGWTPANTKVILHRARKHLQIVINKLRD